MQAADRTDNRDDEIEIDLSEVFGLLWHKLWILLISGIVCAVAGFVLSFFVIPPQYESTTKIYILNRQNSNTVTYSDTQLATSLTKDYEELVTSRTVLEAIIKKFGLDQTYEEMEQHVSVENTVDTRIISITVKDPDPHMAQSIANAIRDVAATHIQKVMDIEAVNVVDEANLPDTPSEPSVPKWTAIAALIGLLLSSMIIILRYLTDDTIKTSDDIEKYLSMSTLAMIPVIEEDDKRKRKSSDVRHRQSDKAVPSPSEMKKVEPEILEEDNSNK